MDSGPSVIEAQKLQALRVNRVAIIQTLRVEHVLPHLLEKRVLTAEDNAAILERKKTQDKTRCLLDLLPQNDRSIDWYRHFKDSLKNPDTKSKDIRRKYGILLDFLGNTILPNDMRPERVQSVDAKSDHNTLKLPRYDPLPGIQNGDLAKDERDLSQETCAENIQLSNSVGVGLHSKEKGQSEEPENPDKDVTPNQKQPIVIKGYFHKRVSPPDNFKSLLAEPKDLYSMLETSGITSDQQQLEEERKILTKLRNLEIVLALDKRRQLPEGFEICTCNAADEILSQTKHYHFYYKYFKALYDRHQINIPAELSESYCNMLDRFGDRDDEEMREQAVLVGFGLFDLLHDFGMYDRADTILGALVYYLASNPTLDRWMAVWEAMVKLMKLHSSNLKFPDADYACQTAMAMGDKIKAMSFGQDLLDESQLCIELSRVMREQGSVGPAYSWARAALKEVEPDNESGVVEVLCGASLAYSMDFRIDKAEKLAVEAVKNAKHWFGTNHPVYMTALINFCQFSSEFHQDDMGTEAARAAVAVGKKIYGSTGSLLLSQAHLAVARSLVVSQAFSGEEYYSEAQAAWRMAMEVLPPDHPRLAVYRYTQGRGAGAQCLMWKAILSDVGEQQGLLVWADTEIRAALQMFKSHWGEYSLKTAHALMLRGQILAKMNQPEEAEACLAESLSIHRLSVAQNSHYNFLAKATLGMFYKATDKPLEALELLRDVADNTECHGTYLKWVHMSYDCVIELLHSVNRDSEADVYQAALVDWMKRNPKPAEPITWEDLHATPVPYDQFCESFEKFESKVKAVIAKKGFKHLRKNLKELEAK